MAITGGGEDVDRVVRLNDLSLKTLIALVARLKETETEAQFLCREMELDEAYLLADSDLKAAYSEDKEAETLTDLKRTRDLVCSAHDLVGENDCAAAAQHLDRVIEAKVGL